MSRRDSFDPDLDIHLAELSELLESNISNKQGHVDKLIKYYPEHEIEIVSAYQGWLDLEAMKVPVIRPEMDVAFYKMLNKQNSKLEELSTENLGVVRKLNIKWLAIAATFVLGISLGKLLDFSNGVFQNAPVQQIEQNAVRFASIDQTPAASDRIRGINQVRSQDDVDLKILAALNKVVLNDPNVNVRLSAIETMVRFSDIPDARRYLIEAIPYQESAIVQLELADIMIALEEEDSAAKWEELFDSGKLDNDARLHLKESLKTLL